MNDQPVSPETRHQLLIFLQKNKDYAVICMDAFGNVTDWLGAAREVFGYAAGEIRGKNLAAIFTPEDQARKLDVYELNVAAAEGRSEDDRWHVRNDGSRIWASGTVTALRDEHGKLTGYIKVAQDRTDFKTQLEYLDRQNATLANFRERNETFNKTLGHELRNPLSALTNATQIIRRTTPDKQVDLALRVIDRQVAALTRLADDLVDVTRMETGKVALDLQLVDLRRILVDAADGVQQAAQARQLTLQVLMPETALPVQLDEARFLRLVLNLLNNAIKYTLPGGFIWLKATQEGEEIVLRVEDTGIGIAPELLPQIFELFTQDAGAAASAPGGLGIGLAMVREIAEMHGGTVQARSNGAGTGSEFMVRLDVGKPA